MKLLFRRSQTPKLAMVTLLSFIAFESFGARLRRLKIFRRL